MKELQIPTRRVAVTVVTDEHQSLRGELFLVCPEGPGGPADDVLRLLEDERDFLPLAPGPTESKGSFVAKEHVVSVRLEGLGPGESCGSGAAGTRCSLLLSDGRSLTGELCIDAPPSAARLVDRLNLDGSFLPVLHDEGLDFVNRMHIVRAN